MAWGDKRRKGAREGSKSPQFRKDKGQTIDGRCSSCGGVEGRHNQIPVSRPVRDARGVRTGTYKTVSERCPGA